MTKIIPLPPAVTKIYEAVAELDAAYKDKKRKFTPDGHLVGSIGEVIAAEALNLKLYPNCHKGHDAYDANGDVQIKITAGESVSLYETCVRLVVLKVLNPKEAEIICDGPGEPVWKIAGKPQKNGQSSVRLSKLRKLNSN